MLKVVLFTVFSHAAFSVAAQQQPPQAPRKESPAPSTAKKQGGEESNYERRIRTEGAAGGTAPVPEEAREGVGAGAKPHMHFDQLDRGLHRRSDAEVIAPSK